MTTATVSGKCILVVEDDYLLAREVCNDLQEHGATVLGPAPTVHYAQLMLGKRRIDGAVLDIRLFGEDVYRLVDQLIDDRIPVVFATAFDKAQIAEKYRFIEALHKPICLKSLREKVAHFKPLPQSANDKLDKEPPLERVKPRESQSLSERWAAVLVRAMKDGQF
ncbi:response regulator [Pelagibacterium lentulum]|uniref:Response regulatory domain-containing protein n=1 Tax=Pelagibacterium lentulum TaxID=2029865 RepID=A0A916RN34_9HYPH|nr:response regulator [Pelagibacterium lentulum]GGA60328.1 hypothetical protein GCM10011499_33200 [Pelagibacterium lentulum]